MAHSHLTYEQRTIIEKMLQEGASQTAIARAIGVHRSTIKHELDRNSFSPTDYSANIAQRWAMRRKKGRSFVIKKKKRYPLRRKEFRYSISSMAAYYYMLSQRGVRKFQMPFRKLYDFRTKRKARFRYDLSLDQQLQRSWMLSRRKRKYFHEEFDRKRRTYFDWKRYNRKSDYILGSGPIMPTHSRKRFYVFGTKRGEYRIIPWMRRKQYRIRGKNRIKINEKLLAKINEPIQPEVLPHSSQEAATVKDKPKSASRLHQKEFWTTFERENKRRFLSEIRNGNGVLYSIHIRGRPKSPADCRSVGANDCKLIFFIKPASFYYFFIPDVFKKFFHHPKFFDSFHFSGGKLFKNRFCCN